MRFFASSRMCQARRRKVADLEKSARFLAEASGKKLKRDQKSEKATLAILRSHHKLACVSQDVELPEPTVGCTNQNRSVSKKGERSLGARLELSYTDCGKMCQHSGTNRTIFRSCPGQGEHPSKFQTALGRRWSKKSNLALDQHVVQNFTERTCRTKPHSSNRSQKGH